MPAKDPPPLDKSNAVERYVKAKDCCEQSQKTAALEFIGQNFELVSDTQDFHKTLSAAHLADILASPQLVADTKLLFQVVVHWANVDYPARGGDHLETLLKAIPFAAAHPDDEPFYMKNALIRRSARLTNLMCDLWDLADTQRPAFFASNKSGNVWFADITALLQCPIQTASPSFFFVRQGYLFELLPKTHKHFAKHDKGLDVCLRVRRAEKGWQHTNHPLRQLHVKVCFWLTVNNEKPICSSASRRVDLMNVKVDKETKDWFCIEPLVTCKQLCKIVDADSVLLGIRLDIEKIRTAGSCKKKEPKDEKEDICCWCVVCCKKVEEKKKATCDCEICSPPKKEEKPPKCCCVLACEEECKKKCCNKVCCEHKLKDCEAKCEKDCAGKCEQKCSCCPKPKKEEPKKKQCACPKCKPKSEEKAEVECKCDKCVAAAKKKKEKEKEKEKECTCSVCSVKSTSELCKSNAKSSDSCARSFDICIHC